MRTFLASPLRSAPAAPAFTQADKQRLDVLAGLGRGEPGARAVTRAELDAALAALDALEARVRALEALQP